MTEGGCNEACSSVDLFRRGGEMQVREVCAAGRSRDQHAERKAEAPEVRPEVAALIERQRDAQRHHGECRCGAGFARYCCAHCWPQ